MGRTANLLLYKAPLMAITGNLRLGNVTLCQQGPLPILYHGPLMYFKFR